MQCEMSSVGEHQFIEADFNLSHRREIRIQRGKRPLAVRQRFDLSDFADDLGADRDDDMIKRIDRLYDATANRLPHFLHLDFIIQSDLQGRAFRH